MSPELKCVDGLYAFVVAMEAASEHEQMANVRWLMEKYLPEQPSANLLAKLQAENARLARDNKNYEWLIAELQDSIAAKDSEILMLRKRAAGTERTDPA
jgi:hypothetical protein